MVEERVLGMPAEGTGDDTLRKPSVLCYGQECEDGVGSLKIGRAITIYL